MPQEKEACVASSEKGVREAEQRSEELRAQAELAAQSATREHRVCEGRGGARLGSAHAGS